MDVEQLRKNVVRFFWLFFSAHLAISIAVGVTMLIQTDTYMTEAALKHCGAIEMNPNKYDSYNAPFSGKLTPEERERALKEFYTDIFELLFHSKVVGLLAGAFTFVFLGARLFSGEPSEMELVALIVASLLAGTIYLESITVQNNIFVMRETCW